MKRPRRIPEVAREVFRVDAKAEKDLIVIGGWEVGQEGKTEDARWFSMELTRRNAPWAFLKGEPFRNIFVVGADGGPGGHHLLRRRSRMLWKKGCHENLRHHRQFGELLCSSKNDVMQVSIVDSGDGIGMSVRKSGSGVGPDVGS